MPELLIDGDTLPWRFKPDKTQLAALENADLTIRSGPELDPNLAKALSTIQTNPKIIEVLSRARS